MPFHVPAAATRLTNGTTRLGHRRSGAFGSRLVRGLLATTDLDVIVAGRDLLRAQVAVHEVQDGSHSSRATTICVDSQTVTGDQLQALGAFVVVDAAGPFQGGS